MKLQRYELIADLTGSDMQQREDGDRCDASDVEPLEDVAKLILVSPATGDRLERSTEAVDINGAFVFQVSNRREAFEVSIRMTEV